MEKSELLALGAYTAVSKEDGQEDSIYSGSSYIQPPRSQVWRTRLIAAFNISLFLISLIFFYNSFKRQNHPLKQTSYYSPLFERINIPLVSKVVQGALFNEDDVLLRNEPSPEVDDAWTALTDIGVVVITGEEVVKLGKDPKKTVKAPLAWGYGNDAHLAQPDGQHALHCLNALRRYAYREYYFPTQTTCPSNTTSKIQLEPYHQAHLSHCLHILLQTLTCDFSTDIITHNWKATQKYPFPDFAINKKCKDHSKLLEWQNKEKVSIEMWMEMAARGPSEETGETVIQLPPKFKEWSEKSEVDGSVIGAGKQVDHGHEHGN